MSEISFRESLENATIRSFMSPAGRYRNSGLLGGRFDAEVDTLKLLSWRGIFVVKALLYDLGEWIRS